MNNLQNFLYGIAEGIIEQAERMEIDPDGGESEETLALRDYYSQIVAVAEFTDDHERIDWQELDDRVGIDLQGIYGHQVVLNGQKQGSIHLDPVEAENHAKGLRRVNPEWSVEIKTYEGK